MSLITTDSGRIVLKKASSMMAVPYVYDSTIGDYVLGGDVYDISAVIGDSIVIEQSDGNTEAKYNEFKSSPLLEIHSGGKYNFSAQCLDLQSNVLRSLFGAMTDSNGNAIAFSDDFVELYVLIRIRFSENSLPDVFLPKVQMNSKLFINQLKTRASQGNIVGVSLASFVAVPREVSTSALQFNVLYANNATYTPFTPVLFIPKGKTPLFYHHKGNGNLDTYSTVNFTNGEVLANAQVNRETGAIQYQQPN